MTASLGFDSSGNTLQKYVGVTLVNLLMAFIKAITVSVSMDYWNGGMVYRNGGLAFLLVLKLFSGYFLVV